MLEFLLSLSLASGALVVAAISGVVAVFIGFIPRRSARWAAVLAVSFLASYALYWSPVWLGRDASEDSAWALVCIVPWTMAGIASSVLVVVLTRHLRRRQ